MNTVTIIVLLFCFLINIYECPVTRERKDGSRKHSESANKGKCKNVITDPQEQYKGRKRNRSTCTSIYMYGDKQKTRNNKKRNWGRLHVVQSKNTTYESMLRYSEISIYL